MNIFIKFLLSCIYVGLIIILAVASLQDLGVIWTTAICAGIMLSGIILGAGAGK